MKSKNVFEEADPFHRKLFGKNADISPQGKCLYLSQYKNKAIVFAHTDTQKHTRMSMQNPNSYQTHQSSPLLFKALKLFSTFF